jgi:citrate synthase
MKKSSELYLSAREASAELAISPATLYAYVSRGLIRSEPSPDSRSHRYRAEDIRGLKERRTPSVEPHGFKSFDPELPVMDSAIATITEQGAIYRGVNCVDLAEKDTLEHTATLLWDVTGVDPFAPDNCPHVSDEMRAIAEAARRAACARGASDGRRAYPAASGRDHAQHGAIGRAAPSADRQSLGAG